MDQVASQLGSSKGYIANVESGTTNLSLLRVIEFSKILEVDPAWLTGFRNSDEGLYIDELADFITDDFVLKSTFLEKKGLKSDRI
ncbi:XRE family transcriptional regulator [Zooshikella ganghwensis]|uniref:XRE family transcriptional regulator n=1 Tax=Zooshikella ganghwensis TaxID=202772 RepID=A0A4P9VGT1_9GAMM|nr:XRE family transcriptional regulator [Zooshikella ganghwensis]